MVVYSLDFRLHTEAHAYFLYDPITYWCCEVRNSVELRGILVTVV